MPKTRLERHFQSALIRELKKRFKGCLVLKLSTDYIQGLPDLLILWGKQWATIECKRCKAAHHQPNQDYYVSLMNRMSFSRFCYPENKEEVLHDLEQAFKPVRNTRVSGGQ